MRRYLAVVGIILATLLGLTFGKGRPAKVGWQRSAGKGRREHVPCIGAFKVTIFQQPD